MQRQETSEFDIPYSSLLRTLLGLHSGVLFRDDDDPIASDVIVLDSEAGLLTILRKSIADFRYRYQLQKYRRYRYR